MMWFQSDNAGPAHPSVLAAIARANAGYAPSYGAEVGAGRAAALVRAAFEAPEAAVFLVATGTAANALALACLCPPWGTVFCHTHAHLQEDECGALGFFAGGATTTPVAGAHGRIDPDALAAAIARTGGSVHGVQPGALTLTNATEAGTLYSPAAVARLAGVARGAGLPVHMDGARFANAVAALGCTPAELTWKAGVDALSLGGGKNGLFGVEAVVLFDPARAWEFELRRKRAGHLASKHRFLSAQIEAYFEDGLWLELARSANAAAARLSAGLAAIPGVRIEHPTEANEVFAAWPKAGHARARAAGAQYHLWSFDDPAAATLEGSEEGSGDGLVPARLVCDWSAEAGEVDRFVALVAGGR